MLEAIAVAAGVVVPAGAMELHVTRSSGPGGQNVNKVSSKVELRVDLARIEGLDAGARRRLAELCAGRLDAAGHLLVTSQRTRDQRRNLEDARAKVRLLVLRAIPRPRPRRKTRPTAASVARRIEDKRRRSRVKQARRDASD